MGAAAAARYSAQGRRDCAARRTGRASTGKGPGRGLTVFVPGPRRARPVTSRRGVPAGSRQLISGAAFAGRTRVTFIGTGCGRWRARSSGSRPVDGDRGLAARPRARGPRRGAPPRRRRVAVAHELRLRSLSAAAAPARRGLNEGGRDAAAETKAARDRARPPSTTRARARPSRGGCAAQSRSCRPTSGIREAMTRDVDAARRAARDGRRPRRGRVREGPGRSRRCAGASAPRRAGPRARGAGRGGRGAEARGEAPPAQMSKLRRDAALPLARRGTGRSRPGGSCGRRRGWPAAGAGARAARRVTEEGASSSAGDGADASSASSRGGESIASSPGACTRARACVRAPTVCQYAACRASGRPVYAVGPTV